MNKNNHSLTFFFLLERAAKPWGHSPGVFAELFLHGDLGEVWVPRASQGRGGPGCPTPPNPAPGGCELLRGTHTAHTAPRQALAVGEAPRSMSQPRLCQGLDSRSSSRAGALPPPPLHWPQKEIPKGKE